MKEMLKYIMCANFMEIGWVVFPQLCLLCKEAVAWSYNKCLYLYVVLTFFKIFRFWNINFSTD